MLFTIRILATFDYFMYKIKIAKFEGPLSLLLKLIEEDKLEITEISLSQVTDQFLDYIKENENFIAPGELADFLLVAGKLLVIKSSSLLPGLMEEDEFEGELENQLKIYKIFRDASLVVKGIIDKKNFSYKRARQKFSLEEKFYSPQDLQLADLEKSFNGIIKNLELSIKKEQQKESINTVSIGQRINDLKNLISKVKKFGFKSFLSSARNRSEVVVSFLALLELIKQRHLLADQDSDDIKIIVN